MLLRGVYINQALMFKVNLYTYLLLKVAARVGALLLSLSRSLSIPFLPLSLSLFLPFPANYAEVCANKRYRYSRVQGEN